MKRYSRVISLLLSLMMVLSLMAAAFAADGDFGDCDYDFTDDTDDSAGDTDVPGDDAGSDTGPDLALAASFSDVETTAWYYDDVTECAKLGIVQGFSDGAFKPDDKVTDVQFIVMMTRTFFNGKVESITVPAGSKWYYANTKAAADTGLSDGLTIEDKPMSRYNMALVLYNELGISGKTSSATSANLEKAKTAVKDYSSMTKKQQTHFRYCYALGILTGMSDGTFSGESSMTRAQACTVIMRMLKLVNNYNPGDADNDQYDDGKSQDTGNNNQSKVTVEQALSVIANLKKQYPAGSTWDDKGTNGSKYSAGTKSTDVLAVTNKFYSASSGGKLHTSTTLGCGGWAAMVSDAIFGQSGAPAREVTDPSKVRPGDICILFNAKGQLKHVSIATSTPRNIDGTWRFDYCDAGGSLDASKGTVNWHTSAADLWSNANGALRAWTRYAD